jgi:hypothetical protein
MEVRTQFEGALAAADWDFWAAVSLGISNSYIKSREWVDAYLFFAAASPSLFRVIRPSPSQTPSVVDAEPLEIRP